MENSLRKSVKILLAYTAVSQGSITHELAARFVGSYLACPPGVEHDTVIVCNGGPLARDLCLLFDPLGATFFPRVNDEGYDLTGYQDVAGRIPCEMLVCLGESVYFHRGGWLKKLAQAWNLHGPGMYGLWTSNLIRPHMNTTGFVADPQDLKTYPRPTNRKERYEFEHGKHSFWRHLYCIGKPTKLVTWDGVWEPPQWRVPPDILWRGSQENCLMYCNHTDRYRSAPVNTRQRWEKAADQPFR